MEVFDRPPIYNNVRRYVGFNSTLYHRGPEICVMEQLLTMRHRLSIAGTGGNVGSCST